jgi:hypothetical protein
MPTNHTLPYKQGSNPNSLAAKSQEKAFDRHTQIEVSKINAQAQIEVAKIHSKKDVQVSKIETDVKKEIAKEDIKIKKEIAKETAANNVEITKINAQSSAYSEKMTLYMVIIFAILALIGLILWFIQKRKATQIHADHEKERLKQELLIKERELEEQKIIKIMDLAIHGQLPQNLQKDLIDSITQPKQEKTTLIEKPD